MTEKRFTYDFVSVDCPLFYDNEGVIDYDDVVDLLNSLYKENQQLKQSNKDAKYIIKDEFIFASEQRQKHLDDPIIANAYDIIRYDMKKALDKLGDIE